MKKTRVVSDSYRPIADTHGGQLWLAGDQSGGREMPYLVAKPVLARSSRVYLMSIHASTHAFCPRG